jgi:hypothetical protein
MRMPDQNIRPPPPHLTGHNLRRSNTPMRTRMTRRLHRRDLVSSIEVIRYCGDGFVTTTSTQRVSTLIFHLCH